MRASLVVAFAAILLLSACTSPPPEGARATPPADAPSSGGVVGLGLVSDGGGTHLHTTIDTRKPSFRLVSRAKLCTCGRFRVMP